LIRRRLNTINKKDTDEHGFSRILIRVHPRSSASYFSKEIDKLDGETAVC
jgi:hypothetical protein